MEKLNFNCVIPGKSTVPTTNARPNEPILLTVTTAGANETAASRGSSPHFDFKLRNKRWQQEFIMFEEGNDLIHDVATLSSAIGLVKSFSTTDISLIPRESLLEPTTMKKIYFRNAVSETVISSVQRSNYFFEKSKFENISRSCSTWVTVGDISSTSQLPSPHGRSNVIVSSSGISESSLKYGQPNFTAADFICSVNKKVRQQYIKKRLLTIYKALQCLSQSEFNLDRLDLSTAAFVKISKNESANQQHNKNEVVCPATINVMLSEKKDTPGISSLAVKQNNLLTIRDVDREKGQPLSKYDRNMMIFNWLLTLDFDANKQEMSAGNNLIV